ncbi:MAG: hypothetical protein M1817_000426 [Caeruleum heppii]|nr:MAG: hypothetical protein M1817_000426 [Caeruleum heppii]
MDFATPIKRPATPGDALGLYFQFTEAGPRNQTYGRPSPSDRDTEPRGGPFGHVASSSTGRRHPKASFAGNVNPDTVAVPSPDKLLDSVLALHEPAQPQAPLTLPIVNTKKTAKTAVLREGRDDSTVPGSNSPKVSSDGRKLGRRLPSSRTARSTRHRKDPQQTPTKLGPMASSQGDSNPFFDINFDVPGLSTLPALYRPLETENHIAPAEPAREVTAPDRLQSMETVATSKQRNERRAPNDRVLPDPEELQQDITAQFAPTENLSEGVTAAPNMEDATETTSDQVDRIVPVNTTEQFVSPPVIQSSPADSQKPDRPKASSRTRAVFKSRSRSGHSFGDQTSIRKHESSSKKHRKKGAARSESRTHADGSSRSPAQSLFDDSSSLLLLHVVKQKLNNDLHRQQEACMHLVEKEKEVAGLVKEKGCLLDRIRDLQAEKDCQKHEQESILEGHRIKLLRVQKMFQGLTIEQACLKEEHRTLTEQNEALQDHRKAMDESIFEARQAAEVCGERLDSLKDPSKPWAEARRRLDELETTNALLRNELEEKAGLLATERDRTARLESEQSTAASSHAELKSTLSDQRTMVMGRFAELQSSLEASDKSGDIVERLVQCTKALQDSKEGTRTTQSSIEKVLATLAGCSEKTATTLRTGFASLMEIAKHDEQAQLLILQETKALKRLVQEQDVMKADLGRYRDAASSWEAKSHMSDVLLTESRQLECDLRSQLSNIVSEKTHCSTQKSEAEAATESITREAKELHLQLSTVLAEVEQLKARAVTAEQADATKEARIKRLLENMSTLSIALAAREGELRKAKDDRDQEAQKFLEAENVLGDFQYTASVHKASIERLSRIALDVEDMRTRTADYDAMQLELRGKEKLQKSLNHELQRNRSAVEGLNALLKKVSLIGKQETCLSLPQQRLEEIEQHLKRHLPLKHVQPVHVHTTVDQGDGVMDLPRSDQQDLPKRNATIKADQKNDQSLPSPRDPSSSGQNIVLSTSSKAPKKTYSSLQQGRYRYTRTVSGTIDPVPEPARETSHLLVPRSSQQEDTEDPGNLAAASASPMSTKSALGQETVVARDLTPVKGATELKAPRSTRSGKIYDTAIQNPSLASALKGTTRPSNKKRKSVGFEDRGGVLTKKNRTELSPEPLDP